MHIVYGFFGNLYYVLRKYMRELEEYFKNRRFAPMGKVAGAGKLGQKCLILEAYSKWKKEESKRVGAKVYQTGSLLQVEKRRKKKTVETRKKHMYNRDA